MEEIMKSFIFVHIWLCNLKKCHSVCTQHAMYNTFSMEIDFKNRNGNGNKKKALIFICQITISLQKQGIETCSFFFLFL